MSVPAPRNEYVPAVRWMLTRLSEQEVLEALEFHRRPVPEDAAPKHVTYQYIASTDSNTDTGGTRLLATIRFQVTARIEGDSLDDIQEEADAIDAGLADQGGLDPSGDFVCHGLRVRLVQPTPDTTAGGRRWTELGGVYDVQVHALDN